MLIKSTDKNHCLSQSMQHRAKTSLYSKRNDSKGSKDPLTQRKLDSLDTAKDASMQIPLWGANDRCLHGACSCLHAHNSSGNISPLIRAISYHSSELFVTLSQVENIALAIMFPGVALFCGLKIRHGGDTAVMLQRATLRYHCCIRWLVASVMRDGFHWFISDKRFILKPASCCSSFIFQQMRHSYQSQGFLKSGFLWC